VIIVRDNGAGIAPEMLPHLFKMFVHVDSSLEPKQRGLGIGLTLVKRIMDLHGGKVEARSDGAGKGTEFAVRLPIANQRPRKRRARPSQTTGNGARRILVVDDDRDLARSMEMALTSMGNEVRTAHDGDEALQVAAEFRPQAVAIDVSLPTMSGFDVVQQLRKETWGEKIIAIALTGWTQDEVRQRALDAGFDHFVVKPVEAALLTELSSAGRPSH
jgi:CheY-like chemotaxis protein